MATITAKNTTNVQKVKKSKSWNLFLIRFEYDWKFFAILPSLNVNLHSKSLELELFFFGLYVDKYKKTEEKLVEKPVKKAIKK